MGLQDDFIFAPLCLFERKMHENEIANVIVNAAYKIHTTLARASWSLFMRLLWFMNCRKGD